MPTEGKRKKERVEENIEGDIGDKALSGIKERIKKSHTFDVPQYGYLNAKGVMIFVYPAGSQTARWKGKDTGDKFEVFEGETIQVYNVTISFIFPALAPEDGEPSYLE